MAKSFGSGMPLPKDFAIAPYYEMALDAAHPLREVILPPLSELDTFFAGDAR